MAKKVTITLEYPSQAAAAKAFGISPAVVSNRLKQGQTIEQALALVPCPKQSSRAVTVNGKMFDSISDAAKAYNISIQTVYQRIHRYGWSVEKALTVPIIQKAVKPRLDKI